MKKEVNKYIVTILGESYTLLSDESEQDVRKASNQVDILMNEIAHKAPHISNHDRAILVALKLALALVNLESESENNEQFLKNLIHSIESENMV